MTVAARRELALRTAVRYKNAARSEKKRILDEFLESTGFHRKHATRLLNDILRGERPRREPRGRVRRYGPAVQAALIAAWRTVNYVCGKTARSVSAGADPDHGASRASVIVR